MENIGIKATSELPTKRVVANMLASEESVCVLRALHTLTDCVVVLSEPGLTDTLEGADGVVARGVFVTRAVGTLVDVVVTVTAREAGRTLGAAGCNAAISIAVSTVAVTKTVLAPRAARTGCKRNLVVGHYIQVQLIVPLMLLSQRVVPMALL